jgi:8-oxo-dGTP pyrophosphatase MutT (NUDIX family)
MHRRLLLELLERHVGCRPEDRTVAEQVSHFVRSHPDCFERTCREGHITGSAWILSPDHHEVLLTHHRKLGRWLQLGGHSDGEGDPRQVALREAREESGLERFRFLPDERDPLPLDLDIHPIPAHGGEPAHLHLDVRFLLVAGLGQQLRISEESKELRWFPRARLSEWVDEESLLRLERRARELAPLPPRQT